MILETKSDCWSSDFLDNSKIENIILECGIILKVLARIDLKISFYMILLPWVDLEISILSQYGTV